MNRRAFLQFTIALAVAAPLAHLGLPAYADPALPRSPPRSAWEPTPEEVHEWLQYYKRVTSAKAQDFHSVMATAFDQDDMPLSVERTRQELEMYEEAQRAYWCLEGDRRGVGPAQGDGYFAGRSGQARSNPRYLGPSNEGFAWFNGWTIGNNDRLGRVTPA